MKLYIEGFRGQWGWVTAFYKHINIEKKNPRIECVYSPEMADVIFQCDPQNWKENHKYLDKKIVIANVLDFAEWVGGRQNTEEYVEYFVKYAHYKTAISQKVIGQLKDRGVLADFLFHFPSQVDFSIYNPHNDKQIQKQKRIISFCRGNDPGKRINFAVKAFSKSTLPSLGWEYWLCGPGTPTCDFGYSNKVMLRGWLERTELFKKVAESKITLMPSAGEGLGLPAIESLLLGTNVVVSHIEPMISTFKETAIYFNVDDEASLIDTLDIIGKQGTSAPDQSQVLNWERSKAFTLLELLVENAMETFAQ